MSNWRDFLDAGGRRGRYLPWKEVARATGLSRTTAWRLQKRDDFPAPYAISPGRVGYREDEVEAWQVSRDHSARRVSAPAAPDPPRPTEARAAASSRAEAVGPTVASDRSPPPAPALPPSRDGATPPEPATPSRPATRRRSQHAQAIAQQMRFDF